MLRAALYARYSSDLQREASIEDQFRICRGHAERAGWSIVGTYHDAAISGDGVIMRPGMRSLLTDACSGSFDVVVAEALDRVSRDQADVCALFKHLQFARVMIVTLAEGEINELHVGLKGTMNALFLKDLAAKTHRGLRGRVERGRSAGGLCYGYEVVTTFDAAGEPARGQRRIKEVEARIVRRVFREFASGVSPRAIARRLNDESIPCPSGRRWTDSTIRGQVKRGTGLINNELYIGRLVWNRLRFVKNPETGRRVSRVNPSEEWIVTDVPELRIVDQSLWQAVKDRQRELTQKFAGAIQATRTAPANRLNATHRPRHLLSGLLECGVCGGPYAMRGQDRYACSSHVMSGSCPNSRSVRRTVLEERVLDGLRGRLLAPVALAEAADACAEETNRLIRERNASAEADRMKLTGIKRKKANLLSVIEDGGHVPGVVDRLRDLDARQHELKERIAAASPEVPDAGPNIETGYRISVSRLAETLRTAKERDAAMSIIRGLIERIVLVPGARRGEVELTLHGHLGRVLASTERPVEGE